MAANYFRKNRKNVQKALYSSGFVKTITDKEYTIEEAKLKNVSGKLRKVKLINLPSNAWVINLEIKDNSPFAILGKKPEVAILFYTDNALYILMIEIKAQLKYSETVDSQEKLTNAIRKLAVLFPIHIYDSNFDNIEHQYFGIIAYNYSSHLEGTLRENNTKSKKSPICTVFETETKRDTINLNDDDLGLYKMDVAFCQNPNIADSPEYMEIDLASFFATYPDFIATTTNAKSCPKI
jgi:hypothetical protein